MFFLDVSYCAELAPVIGIIKGLINVVKWAVPILLIVLGTIDLAKAVIASKEDEMKKAQGALIKRAMYAVAVFLVVFLVSFVMNLISSNVGDDTNSPIKCWNEQ